MSRNRPLKFPSLFNIADLFPASVPLPCPHIHNLSHILHNMLVTPKVLIKAVHLESVLNPDNPRKQGIIEQATNTDKCCWFTFPLPARNGCNAKRQYLLWTKNTFQNNASHSERIVFNALSPSVLLQYLQMNKAKKHNDYHVTPPCKVQRSVIKLCSI